MRIRVYCRERTEKKSRREAVEWREARYKMVHCEMREGCEGRERAGGDKSNQGLGIESVNSALST